MGCCCFKCKPDVILDDYAGFHEPKRMPAPTNECDKKFTDKKGEAATFGVGSFCRAQAYFSLHPGVIRSRCGYCGGKTNIGDEPKKVDDHIEVIDIEFDPSITTYAQLLETFWNIHDPSKKAEEVRYSSKIFYHTDDQKKEAEASRMAKDREVIKKIKSPMDRVHTNIWPAKHVFIAKKEEQQYYLQRDKYLLKVSGCTTTQELIYSHLATKLNAFCSGYGMLEQFEAQKDELELDEMTVAYVREKIKRYSKIEQFST